MFFIALLYKFKKRKWNINYLDKLSGWCSCLTSCQVHCATGPSFADSLALKKIILMWSALAGSVGTPLEYTHNLLP